MCNIQTLPFQVDLRELKNLRNTKTRLSSTIKEENEAKKKENDTFGRFPVLRNANLLEFNFKVRETKQKKNLLEKQKKSTTLTFRFSFRPPLCAEREIERKWEGDLEELRMERDALKHQQQIRHINERIMSSIELAFGTVKWRTVEHRIIRYPVCYFENLKWD